MSKIYQLKPNQIVNLRNDLIISEALEEEANTDSAVANDYNNYATIRDNPEATENATPEAKAEANIYSTIIKELYDYSKRINLPTKIATDIEQKNSDISVPASAEFIDKLLYGLYRMADDPALNVGFERLLRNIGVTAIGKILTKDNQLD